MDNAERRDAKKRWEEPAGTKRQSSGDQRQRGKPQRRKNPRGEPFASLARRLSFLSLIALPLWSCSGQDAAEAPQEARVSKSVSRTLELVQQSGLVSTKPKAKPRPRNAKASRQVGSSSQPGFVSSPQGFISRGDSRLSVQAERRASGAVRLANPKQPGQWIELRPLHLNAVPAAHRDAATSKTQDASPSPLVYPNAERRCDTAGRCAWMDLVYALEPGVFEELRVFYADPWASSKSTKVKGPEELTASSELRLAQGLRARPVERRIEVIDALGRVVFKTLPSFAQDAKGNKRRVELSLRALESPGSPPASDSAPLSRGTSKRTSRAIIVAKLNARELSYPIVMDPAWTIGGGWPSETLVGLIEVSLEKEANVEGDVAVVDEGADPELALAKESKITGTVRANRIELAAQSLIDGNASFNTLGGSGTVSGATTTPLSLPLNLSVPSIPSITPGTQTIRVKKGQVSTLSAGSYAKLIVDKSGQVILSGGSYLFSEVQLKKESSLTCSAPCEVLVAGSFETGAETSVGPSASSGLQASAVQIIALAGSGSNAPAGTGDLAIVFGKESQISARAFAPNGILVVEKEAELKGTFIARDIVVKKKALIEGDSGGSSCGNIDDNNPCTADSCDETTGTPIHTPVPAGTACADGDLCNGDEVCDAAGARAKPAPRPPSTTTTPAQLTLVTRPTA